MAAYNTVFTSWLFFGLGKLHLSKGKLVAPRYAPQLPAAVIANFMRNLLLVTILFFLGGFADKSNLNLSVQIQHISLPRGTHYDYYIKDHFVTVKTSGYSLGQKRMIVSDSSTFKVKMDDSLMYYAKNTNWKAIPSQIGGGCIDGYYYFITVINQSDTFRFEVICPGSHPSLNKLINLCYQTLPSKKYRKKYRLWKND
jgi:hypothetical protein